MSINMNLQVSNYGRNYTNATQTLQKNPNAVEYFANTFQNAVQEQPDSPETARLKAIYDQLSENSKNIMEKMKNHQPVSKLDWEDLGKDLLNKGAITQAEYDFTQANIRLVPTDFSNWHMEKDENGNITGGGHSFTVRSDERPFMADRLIARLNGDDSDKWQDDPMSFLDAWIEQLQKMRQERDDDDKLLYRTGAIDEQISAATSVKNLLNDLLSLF